MKYDLQEFDYPTFLLSRKWLQNERLRQLINDPDISEEQALQWFHSLPERRDFVIRSFRIDETPVGTCGFRHIEGNVAEFWGQIGEESLWGQGHGSHMLRLCHDLARQLGITELYLWVNKTNVRAGKLYLRQGFVVVGETEEMLKMSKKVEPLQPH